MRTFDGYGNGVSKNDEHAKGIIDLVMLWFVGVR